MMTLTAQPGSSDLAACDREPIHTPSLIQPHGVLLALDPATRRVAQASANAGEAFGLPLERVLGASLEALLAPEDARGLGAKVAGEALERNPSNLGVCRARAGGRPDPLYAVGHCSDGVPVLEFEFTHGEEAVSFADLYGLVQTFISQLHATESNGSLLALASEEVRRITGFDRVLIYRFDEQWNGTVVAESGSGVLPSYLDLRFPASDIPRQARELYRLNRLRLIADAGYTPVPLTPTLHPATGRPLDMSFCSLRSVSPVHVEYMRNMGTGSSMSISILDGGELWGLISCHSAGPRRVPFEVRAACDFLAQMLSLEIAARDRNADAEERIRVKTLESRLLTQMASAETYGEGLAENPAPFLRLMDATGGAVVTPDTVRLIGVTPTEEQVRDLARWLSKASLDDVYASRELGANYPPAAAYADKAAGLLSLSISELHANFILWFRPEVVRTVRWAGDPAKPAEIGDDRPHPRRSFQLWKQEVRGQSTPWSAAQVEAAADLRNVIVGIVLRKAEELAELSHELELSNKDLEAFSYSVSHDLRAPFRHIVGYSELLKQLESESLSERGRRYIETIIESAQYAGKLVDHLLQFSRMSRSALDKTPVDLRRLVEEVRIKLMRDGANAGRKIEWRVGALPTVMADLFMLRLVVENLLSNAVKYTRPRTAATVDVTCREEPGRWVIAVRDNGVGFDMRYVDKLFGVFQRLHLMEDFEGTGIGLANVRRIVSRHGGETWAEGKVDGGAAFYFTLPKQGTEEIARG